MASLVGGASVITFPVLLALGLPPVVATASNLVAVSAGNFLAAVTDRAKLPPFNRAFVGLVLASVLGALLGAVLLLATPERAVRVPDPAAARLRHRAVRLCRPHHAWLRARASERGREWKIGVTSIPLVLPISIYGGYFGAGAGTLLLGVLMIATEGDYRRANVAKNLVSSLNTFAASVWFIANGAVSWPQTLVMMVGCLVGGVLRRAPGAPRSAGGDAGGDRGGRRGADRGVRLAVLVLGSLRQFHQPLRHRAVRIGHRIADGEVVHAGHRLVARLDALLAPAVGDDPALPQELRAIPRRRPRRRARGRARPARTAARCAAPRRRRA